MDSRHLDEVLQHAVGVLVQIGKMIEPFLPDTAEQILEIFGSGVVKMPDKPLFTKILAGDAAS